MAKVPPYNTEFEERPAEYRNMLSVIKRIVMIAAVTFTTAHLSYASPQHSGAECYHNRRYQQDHQQRRRTGESDPNSGVAGGCGNISEVITVLSSTWPAIG